VTNVELLQRSLEQVVERIGDPAPRVYGRVFDASPELRALFVRDEQGSVRGEMFHRVIETLLDVASQRPYAEGMIAAERINHGGIGVTAQQFDSFFDAVLQVCRQALGADWTAEIDAAWRATIARVNALAAASG
jgi:hemoglobin-like flavoprotein